MVNVKEEILNTAVQCSMRGLVLTSKWLFDFTSINSQVIQFPSCNVKYLQAKSYFDCKDFKKVCLLLANEIDTMSLFLKYYSLYLWGEKEKDLRMPDVLERSKNEALPSNENLGRLENELKICYQKGRTDAYLMYLYGVILKQLGLVKQATSIFLESVHRQPYLWCSWLELSKMTTNRTEFNNLEDRLPSCIFKDLYRVSAMIELQENDEAIKICDSLLIDSPQNLYIIGQKAIALYQNRDFEEAEELFVVLRERDPTNLDFVDYYSNVLFVKEEKENLAILAQQCVEIDHMRPETCCVVGNYYSLRGEHEKSIEYFGKALSLNRNYLAAWTLMGHEYVELKNTSAAIECYRRAVDVNSSDYRAWFGLGQTYEVLRMPYYALHYYEKARDLRPKDSRMWCAVGNCYETLKQVEKAIVCYDKAVQNDSNDGNAMIKLARLYHSMNEPTVAASYYSSAAEAFKNEESVEYAESAIYMANYYKNLGRFEEARKFASSLLTFGGLEREEAKSILKELSQTT
ncbi:cell division cycle protein 23-like protein [Rozella allomycis CSF55]|uniref:Cell division cycle protein 23-like protein n=1 Tax=Rozella allomycis (strain CSF55) TaxID=988480 RepID=A0A075B277_ROZAC|nr:Tetratricopeptide-like helical domain-containing protein [Rozella allomycis CSF55]RKP18629.1 cell division cycle protein 23-like protein [Rozella allomycis CSF55]|eukprot:EPZ36675.1 Tetratricopeptide-like helical domain-containing protein [Rozella allomycis CSF55]